MQQASGIKPSELKKMVDMLQVRWRSLCPAVAEWALGEQRSQGRVKAGLAGFGIATTLAPQESTMERHTLLPLPANWQNPARWILFFWPQLPALSNGQPEAVPPLLAASYSTAWRPFLTSLSAQPGPGWTETHRHSRISALGPAAKDTQPSPEKDDSRDVVLLMEWVQ